MAHTTLPPRAARGSTLLEAVIALSILLVGLLGMFRLQIFGVTSDDGARAHTQAVQVGTELLSALQRLPVDDPRLDDHFTGETIPPAGFGHVLLPGGLTSTPFATWSDATPLPGVRLDADMIADSMSDPVDGSLPRFMRRWTVWMPATVPGTGTDGSKLIAVSITWRERGIDGLREVVLYGTSVTAAAVTTSIASQR